MLRLIPLWLVALADWPGPYYSLVGALLLRIFRGKQRFVPFDARQSQYVFPDCLGSAWFCSRRRSRILSFNGLAIWLCCWPRFLRVLSGLDYIRLGIRIARRRIDGGGGRGVACKTWSRVLKYSCHRVSTRALAGRRSWAPCFARWARFASRLALIPALAFAGGAAALFWLAARPPIRIGETQFNVGERAIAWREIREINRSRFVSPLVLRLRLTNSRQKVLVYPGEPEQVQRLLIELRRNSQLATFDGVTYRDYWTWCTLNSPQGHDPLLEQPVRMFSAEDEAEVERLYQKLKAVGRLDAVLTGSFLGFRRSDWPDHGSVAVRPHMLRTLSTLWPYVRRYRKGLALGIGALLMKDALLAALPLVIKHGIDSLMAGFRLSLVLQFAGLLIGLSAIKGVFQYWMRVIIIGISRDIEFDLRNDLFHHLVALSQDFYGRYRTGDIMARSTNDLNAVRMMLGPGIMYWTETSVTADSLGRGDAVTRMCG